IMKDPGQLTKLAIDEGEWVRFEMPNHSHDARRQQRRYHADDAAGRRRAVPLARLCLTDHVVSHMYSAATTMATLSFSALLS
ncbi:MAG TPA: hypothetical protein VGW38_13180, partial [Chloroflexota bacterium]|nr:hypothetical protein [Chloroflexota bacterium]